MCARGVRACASCHPRSCRATSSTCFLSRIRGRTPSDCSSCSLDGSDAKPPFLRDAAMRSRASFSSCFIRLAAFFAAALTRSLARSSSVLPFALTPPLRKCGLWRQHPRHIGAESRPSCSQCVRQRVMHDRDPVSSPKITRTRGIMALQRVPLLTRPLKGLNGKCEWCETVNGRPLEDKVKCTPFTD